MPDTPPPGAGLERIGLDDRIFGQLLEAAPDAMLVAGSADGLIVLANARVQELFGYRREELAGQPVELLMPARFRGVHPGRRSAYAGAPRTRRMGAHEHLFGLRKDGSEFPAEISLSPLENERGSFVIAAIRDVTEQQLAETERVRLAQAQEALRLRDEFLAVASHELNTPLAALRLQADSIMRLTGGHELPDLGQLAAKARGVLRTTVRLDKLIHQLLDLSQITAGRLELSCEEVELGELAARVIDQFGDELERAGCQATLRAPRPVIGMWDPLRVEQIVGNLVSNAIKYGAGQPIELDIGEAAADLARVTVRDHGIGIAPEHHERIFERFERVPSGRRVAGFGLGLWITRKLIEAHRGRIHLSSAPGAGSEFTVELPRSRPASPIFSAPLG